MKKHYVSVLSFLLTMLTLTAQDTPRAAELQKLVEQAVQTTVTKFASQKLLTNEIAVTLIDLRAADKHIRASYRGDVQIYPASVIKMFYLAATHHWLEEGIISDSEELRRAMRDMIVESGNEPTHYIVDVLTDTTSGPELSPEELEKWMYKRNAVNRYFAALGYQHVNVNRKPWGEGPYGREMQSTKAHKPNHRNWLTTDDTARLLSEIATGKAVSPKRCEEMMELLKRDPFATSNADGQAKNYTGTALKPGDKLWSKAGWTSATRHDAAYVELANGEKFVLVIFTENHASEPQILSTAAQVIVDALRAK